MKRLLPTLAIVLLLTGCTAAQPSDGNTSASTPATVATEAAPAPAPSPVEMTKEEAAVAYLDGVCPSNLAAKTYNEAYDAMVAAGSEADIAPVQQASVALRDANQAAAVAFSADDRIWPSEIQADIDVIAESYFKGLADFDLVIQSQNADQILNIPFTQRTDAEKAAGPRVRTLLGLELDTQASCENR